MDTTTLLAANLIEAFKQINTYLALGLIASISAVALERRAMPAETPEAVTLLGGFPALPRPTAQLLLIGIAFVAGLMASYAAEAAARIVGLLHGSPLLMAACSFSSVATAPIGVPILASSLPVLFAAIVMYRKARSLKEPGIIAMIVLFAAPFIVVAITLSRLSCRAS